MHRCYPEGVYQSKLPTKSSKHRQPPKEDMKMVRQEPTISIRIEAADQWGTWLDDARNDTRCSAVSTSANAWHGSATATTTTTTTTTPILSDTNAWTLDDIANQNIYDWNVACHDSVNSWGTWMDTDEIAELDSVSQKQPVPPTRAKTKKRRETIRFPTPTCSDSVLKSPTTVAESNDLFRGRSVTRLNEKYSSREQTYIDLSRNPRQEESHSPTTKSKYTVKENLEQKRKAMQEKLERYKALKQLRPLRSSSPQKISPRTRQKGLFSTLPLQGYLQPEVEEEVILTPITRRGTITTLNDIQPSDFCVLNNSPDNPALQSLQRAQVFDDMIKEESSRHQRLLPISSRPLIDVEIAKIKQLTRPQRRPILDKRHELQYVWDPALDSCSLSDDGSTVMSDDGDCPRTLVQLRIPASKAESLRVLQIQIL